LSYQAARGFFVGEDASLPTFLRPQSLAVAKNNSLLRRFSGEGVMPERILAQAASEVCRRKRNQLCSTLLSLWQHSYPESDGLKQTLEHGRSLPRLASELTPSKLEDLSRFFDREAVFERRKRPLMATAKLSRMYAEYFHYPIPFEHRALVELWQMCDTPSCDLERANFQEILGPLDPL
jgi:hypothetical protein